MSPPAERLATALAGRYRLERELGQGGMATVYLAEDLKHARKVAIKVLRPELAASLGADRFLREIEIAAGLAHPHVLPLFDSGAAPGDGAAPALLYYVMPYVEGKSLRDRLREEGRLPPDEAVRLAIEVGDALGYAHAQGFVHRDVKPENVLLQGGHAVVADFGIARALSAAGDAHLTGTGLAIGTPAYMSPEQAAGDPHADARSDVYSLGCVLHELLTGEVPFHAPTAPEMLARRLTSDRLPGLRSRGVAVPEPVERALVRALARRPEDRFPTAAAFATALRATPAGAASAGTRWLVPAVLVASALVALALWRPWRAKAGTDALTTRAPASRLTQLTVRDGVEEWPAWSPDGKRLLFVATDSGFRQLFVRDLATGEERQVTHGTRDVIQPAWMPDSRQVVFARATQDRAKLEPRDVFGTYGDDADLWRLHLDTGEERRLVAGAVNPAVSPDGRRLAFDAAWGGARRLWIADTGGRNPQQLTGDSTETVEHVEPRWSPDGRHLAYRRVQKTKSDILVVDVATKAVTWVTDDNVIDLDPVWAPSERALYFTSARGGGLNVWRVAVSDHGTVSGKPQQVTTGAGDDLQVTVAPDGRHLAFTVLGVDSDLQRLPVDPVTGRAKGPPETVTASTRVESRGAWSPDGTRIAFNSDRRGDMNIWIREADGTERQLTTGPGGDYQPEWSPNGQVIAFFSARAGSSDIWTVRVADGTLQRLTQPPGLHTNPFFSPDGRLIAFHSDRDGRNEVWVMNADGGDLRRLTTTGVSGHFVRWTADGRHIVFRGHTASGARAMRVELATGAVEELPEVSSGAHMSFSPDGSRILDVRNHRALWVHPLDGTAAYPVYDVTEPALRIDYPVWSPDGRWILFDRAAPRGGDIWELELLDR